MKLEVRELHKVYADGTVALRSLDLELESGMLGLLGPNGAGKTTFLSILTLGVEASSGTIRFDGLDIRSSGDRAPIRRCLGYLPQSFEPVSELTAREYLRLCARLRCVSGPRRLVDQRITELLEAVDLLEVADWRSGTFSGGMKRRLGIAQALVHDPSLVVVDEPTAGLDPEERIRFRHLITGVAEEKPVILSTHILEDVEATCPRLAVIDRGEMLFDGAPTSLLPEIEGSLWELSSDDPLPEEVEPLGRRMGPDGFPVRIVYSPDPLPGARARSPRLEDAYAYFLRLHAREAA